MVAEKPPVNSKTIPRLQVNKEIINGTSTSTVVNAACRNVLCVSAGQNSVSST